mmetsp:Transcript_83773/g.240835  ORF Transcript_83773/g.240835 Transcript_83773/m.240835 type:complete len:306 (+) Transcript_83773:555-1472(+)
MLVRLAPQPTALAAARRGGDVAVDLAAAASATPHGDATREREAARGRPGPAAPTPETGESAPGRGSLGDNDRATTAATSAVETGEGARCAASWTPLLLLPPLGAIGGGAAETIACEGQGVRRKTDLVTGTCAGYDDDDPGLWYRALSAQELQRRGWPIGKGWACPAGRPLLKPSVRRCAFAGVSDRHTQPIPRCRAGLASVRNGGVSGCNMSVLGSRRRMQLVSTTNPGLLLSEALSQSFIGGLSSCSKACGLYSSSRLGIGLPKLCGGDSSCTSSGWREDARASCSCNASIFLSFSANSCVSLS